jgi:ribosome-associated protein
MENQIQDKSKTQKKKEAEDLQKLGVELTRLSIPQLERMDLPKELRKALIDAKSITSNVAGRRHRQYIGSLMRDVDPEPIRHALLLVDEGLPIESERTKEVQKWVDTLLTGDAAGMEEFLSACPGLERQRLRQLLRNIGKEKKTGKTSKSLKALRKIIQEMVVDQ